MNSKNNQSFSPVIFDYLKKFQEDPTSRVFAPLAEAYRKAGFVDEAIKIAQEGLQVHPQFIGGRVALARALFDKKKYAEVMDELLSVTRDAPDNLIAQRLFAESALMLGRVMEALGAYKILLYFTPHDAEIAQMVRELEEQSYRKGALILRTDPPPQEEEYQISSVQKALKPDRASELEAQQRKRQVRQVQWLQALLERVQNQRVG